MGVSEDSKARADALSVAKLKYHSLWVAAMVLLFIAANALLQIGEDGTTEHWVCLGSAYECMAPSDVTPGAWWAGTFGTILIAVGIIAVLPWIAYRPKAR
ncbi:hypothetical protein [Arthrobacter sp. ISL-65]|uniref:hypothetical protein n=1 Tax=Arthrobacter sp. ISL-65 TaxID=2819112 RepID=UPI001BEA7511|nr:hypothetical protein [Arthrobacter sp. ISL-65]MBT2550885.1 hypothetical protein [Arthrobacter sp. ISL-65]